MEGHGKSWKVMDGKLMDGHRRSWKVVEGHGRSWKVLEVRSGKAMVGLEKS